MPISIHERAHAVRRAKQALKHLHEHPATSQRQLGATRDQMNLVYTLTSTGEVWDCVYAIECIVLEVYGSKVPDQLDAPH